MPEEEKQTPEEDIGQKIREEDPTRLKSEDIQEYLADEEERSQEEPKDVLLQWESREFIQRSRPQQWYILFAVVGIALIVFAIVTSNYLFALIVVILAVVLNTFFHRKPRKVNIAITPEGIAMGENFYPYSEDLVSFWILYDPPDLKTLNFSRKALTATSLTIQLEDQNPLKVREVLLNYLQEDVEKEENPVDSTFRRWGF